MNTILWNSFIINIILICTVVLTKGRPLSLEKEAEFALHKDKLHSLNDNQLSPKLTTFFGKLLSIDPELIKTAEKRLEDRQSLGVSQVQEIFKEATSEEQQQFYEDLEKIEKLYTAYPEAKRLVDSIKDSVEDYNEDHDKKPNIEFGMVMNQNRTKIFDDKLDSKEDEEDDHDATSSEEIYEFFKEFTSVDKTLSQFPEWNRFWALWFGKYAHYMSKYG